MSALEQSLFDLDEVSVPPNERLAAIHQASERIAAENARRNALEVPCITERIALLGATAVEPADLRETVGDLPPAA